MPRIAALPDHLVNQIAAGEVVERPANALKEIVENSIDAGATAIDVELAGGGIRLIRVSDNGSGIHPDDIELALHRHATSKIKTLNDLEHVASMGFRGEGLASIASVSRLTLTSRQEDSSHATQVKAEDGKLSSPTAAAHPVGTTIEAAELFFNTPARRKFLKSEATEYAHCATMLERLALAHPHIAFSLKRDGKQVFKLPEQSLHERIAAIVGDDFQTASLEIDSGSGALRLYGAIAKPTFAIRQNRQTILLRQPSFCPRQSDAPRRQAGIPRRFAQRPHPRFRPFPRPAARSRGCQRPPDQNRNPLPRQPAGAPTRVPHAQ